MGGRKGVKQNFWKGTEMYNYIGYGGWMGGWVNFSLWMTYEQQTDWIGTDGVHAFNDTLFSAISFPSYLEQPFI